MTLERLLPSKFFDVLERAGISTPKQLIVLSHLDIKKLTNLNNDDIMFVKNIVARHLSPATTTGDILEDNQQVSVSTGCTAINNFLNGGLRRGTLTELYGESGSGKTQLGIQAAIYNWTYGCLYICTEDLFPVKRFEQIKQSIPNYNLNFDYGKLIFVEHLTESKELLSCIKVRLPKLLDKNKLSLIIIDSIAAPFRSESTNYILRAEELRELAIALINVAQQYQLAVLCINQVSSSFNESDEIIPCLGLAWSNMVSTRLWLRKTTKKVVSGQAKFDPSTYMRELCIVFAPNLSSSVIALIITAMGIQEV